MLWLLSKQNRTVVGMLQAVLMVVILVGLLPVTTVEAKRAKQVVVVSALPAENLTSATPATTVQPSQKTKKAKQPKHRGGKQQTAQLSTVEFEPPPNPDYPTQLCGVRRQRLLQLQSLPWIVTPFFLAQRRIEHWQYRLCLSRTMPEVQRYLETFPVPYEAPLKTVPTS
jgi:hypothetical protein